MFLQQCFLTVKSLSSSLTQYPEEILVQYPPDKTLLCSQLHLLIGLIVSATPSVVKRV